MESLFATATNGISVQTEDLDLIASEAALADDRVLWELLRVLPQSATPQKGILTYGKSGWRKETGLASTALVSGNSANGSVRVMPFRAVVGSTDSSSETEKLRGMRSGYLTGTSTSYTTVPITANASGSPRWSLVYAAVTPATDSAGVVRYVKDPASKVVSATTVVLTTTCAVTIGTVDGTPAATPTRPALPADAAGTVYLPIAYIWTPDGFGALSIVNRQTIHEVAPVLPIHSSLGVSALQPANQSFVVDGTVDAAQLDATQGYRPGCYLPSTMIGGEARIIPIQLSLSPASHVHGDLVDDSVDWRFRMFRFTAMVVAGSAQANGMVFDRNGTGGQQNPRADLSLPADTYVSGMGQSLYTGSAVPTGYTMAAITNFGGFAAWIDDGLSPQLGAFGSAVGLYVNSSDGALYFAKSTSGSAGGQLIIWIEATSPLSNHGTI